MTKSDSGAGEKAPIRNPGPATGPKNQQIDGGWKIGIYTDDTKTTLIGQIITSTNETGFRVWSEDHEHYDDPALNTEFWWVDPAQISNLGERSNSIYIESIQVVDNAASLLSDAFDPDRPSFSAAEAATWSTTGASGSNSAFKGKIHASPTTDLYLRITLNADQTQIEKAKWMVPGTTWNGGIVPKTGTWSMESLSGEFRQAFSRNST